MESLLLNSKNNFAKDRNKMRERKRGGIVEEEVNHKIVFKGQQLAQSGASQTTVQTIPNHTNSASRRRKKEGNKHNFMKHKHRAQQNNSYQTGEERADLFRGRHLFDKFFTKYKENKFQNIGMADLDKIMNYFPYCEEENSQQVSHRKKKNEDKQYCYKTKRKDKLLNQRKSQRIQKQEEKDRMDVQMMQMAVYFNQGNFRYNCKEAELKLSYLDSNSGDIEFYSKGRNLVLEDEPLFSSLGEDAVRNILVDRARSLMARVIHSQKLA